MQKFFINEQNMTLIFNYFHKLDKDKNLYSAPEFYDYDDSPQFIYMMFIISNSLQESQNDETFIIGSYRTYLKQYAIQYFDEIEKLCWLNKKFCQFTLWAWDFDFQIEKYKQLETILLEKHKTINED